MVLDISVSAQKKKGEPLATSREIICTLEMPEGSGCKCGEKSFDGVMARCEAHKKHAGPADIGLQSSSVQVRPRHSHKEPFGTR
jgi:hypothetical protein